MRCAGPQNSFRRRVSVKYINLVYTLLQVEMAIQLPNGDSSPHATEDEGKENLTGFERASQEIEKAGRESPPKVVQPGRTALSEQQTPLGTYAGNSKDSSN